MNTPRRKNYWLPPKGASEFFLPSADDEFKSKHPVGYRFLVLLGATVLILPMMIYGIIVSIHLGKESSIWLLLGGVGSFLIGIGLFNIVAITIKQYLGHLVSILAFAIGSLFIWASFVQMGIL